MRTPSSGLSAFTTTLYRALNPFNHECTPALFPKTTLYTNWKNHQEHYFRQNLSCTHRKPYENPAKLCLDTLWLSSILNHMNPKRACRALYFKPQAVEIRLIWSRRKGCRCMLLHSSTGPVRVYREIVTNPKPYPRPKTPGVSGKV